jgi:hypothetical protein
MEKRYICDSCNFTSNLKGDYNRHLKTKKHIRNTNHVTYKCKYCSKTYSRRDNLQRHMKQHIQIQNENKQIQKLEQENEKFQGILKEKERCIEALLQKQTNVTNNTLQVVNHIYTMKPLAFLNTYYSKNPGIQELIDFMGNKQLTNLEKETLQQALQYDNKWAMSLCIDEIMKKRNRELIQERNITDSVCNQVFFTNDGSLRRFIAKGKKEWEFFSHDSPLEESTEMILNQSSNNPVLLGKKERNAIINHMKRNNDWNKEKNNFPQIANASQQMEHIIVNEHNHILDEKGDIIGLRIPKNDITEQIEYDYKFFQ